MMPRPTGRKTTKTMAPAPPVNTQPYPLHSPLEDTSVASAVPLTRPRVEADNATPQTQEGDLLYVRLLGDDNIIYDVYQDWLHQNPRDHFNLGIAEDSKWQARWENLFVFRPNAITHLPGSQEEMFGNTVCRT